VYLQGVFSTLKKKKYGQNCKKISDQDKIYAFAGVNKQKKLFFQNNSHFIYYILNHSLCAIFNAGGGAYFLSLMGGGGFITRGTRMQR
jgi:hypothetical protein